MKQFLFRILPIFILIGTVWPYQTSFAQETMVSDKSKIDHKTETQIRRVPEKIVGGEEAKRGQWPWMVTLLSGQGGAYKRHFCGGTLIARQWVLTAAHCVSGMPSASLVVGIKIHNLAEDLGEEISVHKIFIHSEYNPYGPESDIALLKLVGPVSESDRVLDLIDDPRLMVNNTMATVTGWGYLEENGGAMSESLQQVDVPLTSCNSNFDAGEIHSDMICAGQPAGGIDSCQGDSGGPLMVQDGDIWKQVGIVSWGYGCARPGLPGVYTNIYNFLDWIRETQGISKPLNLIKGWNLIATTLSSSIDIDDYFAKRNFSSNKQAFRSVWARDTATNNWYWYSPTMSTETFNHNQGTNYLPFTTIDSGMGFWIDISEEVTHSYIPPIEMNGYTIDSSILLPLYEEVSGSINDYSAVNYFHFEITTNGDYTIGTTSTTLDSVGTLYNDQKIEIAKNDDSPGSANFQII